MKNTALIGIVMVLMLLSSCKQKKKYHDIAEQELMLLQTDATADIIKFQQKLNEEFRDPETSPLPDKYRKDFEGLDFFIPDTSYVIEAKLIRTPQAIPFMMPTTTDRKSEKVVYGIAYFNLNGKARQLEIYHSKKRIVDDDEDYLFLPFTDLSNGEETYTGGRYISLSIPKTDAITIDFNRAYNPYCAYNNKYSCPIVPSVNHLDTQILAGVKDFKKGH